MPDARVTLRRRNPYATKSNRFRKVKTPGGKLVVQYIKKQGTPTRCGDTHTILNGISIGRPKDYMRMSKPKKTVTRVYGGNLCAKAVRERYVAFAIIAMGYVCWLLRDDALVGVAWQC